MALRPPPSVPAIVEPYPRCTRLRRRLEGWKAGTSRAGTSTGSPVLGLRARAGLAVSHVEGAESPELDSIASRERLLHGGQKGVDHQRASLLGDTWSDRISDLLNEVRLVILFSSPEWLLTAELVTPQRSLRRCETLASNPLPGQPLAPGATLRGLAPVR